MKKTLFFSLLFALHVKSSATAIVAIVTKKEIVLAVDSKIYNTKDGKPAVVSKIFNVGDYYFALGGLRSAQISMKERFLDTEISKVKFEYSPINIVRDILRSNQSFELIRKDISTKWPNMLINYLEQLRATDLKAYQHVVAQNLVHALFLVFKVNGVPYLYHISIKTGEDPVTKKVVAVWSDFYSTCDKIQKNESFEIQYGSDKRPAVNKETALKNPKKEAERLVEAEYINMPDAVGPPVNVVRFKKNRIKWYRRNKEVPTVL